MFFFQLCGLYSVERDDWEDGNKEKKGKGT